MMKLSEALDLLRRVKKRPRLKLPIACQIWALEVEHSHIGRISDIVDIVEHPMVTSYMSTSHEEGVYGEAYLLFSQRNVILNNALPPEFIKYVSRVFYLPFTCHDPDWLVSRALAIVLELGERCVLKISATPKELEPALADALLTVVESTDNNPLSKSLSILASAKKCTHILYVAFSKEESLFRWGLVSIGFATENFLNCEALDSKFEQSRAVGAQSMLFESNDSDNAAAAAAAAAACIPAVCRAYFKVKECFEQTFPLILKWRLPDPDTCISCDVGASPGGWTQILSQYSGRVVSIDPGLLHPSVLALPNVTYIGKTLQQSDITQVLDDLQLKAFSLNNIKLKLKLIVCDVNFEPAETAKMLCSHLLASLDGLQQQHYCTTHSSKVHDRDSHCHCHCQANDSYSSSSFVILTLKMMKNPRDRHIEKVVSRVLDVFRQFSPQHERCWQHHVVHLTANSKNERTILLRLH